MFVSCPTCQKQVKWEGNSEHRPFCSKKCQLIDLGDWATETHAIPSENLDQIQSSHLDEEAIAEAYEQQQESFFK